MHHFSSAVREFYCRPGTHFWCYSVQIKIIFTLVLKNKCNSRHILYDFYIARFHVTYSHFSSNCELFISFYIRQSHKLQTNGVVRVYLIADGNETYVKRMHLKRATFAVYRLAFLGSSHSFPPFYAHANAKILPRKRSWILPVNSTCNSQLNMSAFLILTLFLSHGVEVHVLRIPFVLSTFSFNISFVLFPFIFITDAHMLLQIPIAIVSVAVRSFA